MGAHRRRTQVWAHRGYSKTYPENTRASFQAALEVGVDGLELDVHMTLDGHVVVLHDETVDRTTNGAGLVSELTLAELRRLDAGSWKDEHFFGEHVPTLEEVYRLVVESGRAVQINVELKESRVQGLERAAWDLTRTWGLARQVCFSSFQFSQMKCMRELAAEAQIAVLNEDSIVDAISQARALRAQALHLPWAMVREQDIHQVHAEGFLVRLYTVNDAKVIGWCHSVGVDAIMTDCADVAVTAVRGSRKVGV